MVNSAIGIAGAGRIGQALGRLLRDLGEPVKAIAGRDFERTATAAAFVGNDVQPVSFGELPSLCSRVLIAVPDDALDSIASILARTMREGVALHTCGARGPEALTPLKAHGVACAALHPLQSVPTPEQGLTALPGAPFGITGSESPALEWALEIVALLHGEALQISSQQRPIYHAAAVMASNYSIVVLDAAVMLMKEAGMEEQQALRALTPLIRASVGNALAVGPLKALTGPIERGDNGTIAAHLRALAGSPAPESVKALYRAAGLHALDMARRKRPGADREEMELLLSKWPTMNEQLKKVWPLSLKEMKQRGEKIAVLTAYDAMMARLLDCAGIDVLLVGDSLGMVLLGYETTVPVTMDVMVHHTAAVSRGAKRALIVADMPFLSYQVTVPEALRNAGRLVQSGGANAVKLEGGQAVSETTRRLVDAGIPVMGHLGLTPQSVNRLGGFRRQAKSKEDAQRLMDDAKALEAAGVFAIVLESIPAELARTVSAQLSIPTIGIGAGAHCDGQVLVSYDVLGLTGYTAPSFAKRYAQLGEAISEAAKTFAQEVRGGQFP